MIKSVVASALLCVVVAAGGLAEEPCTDSIFADVSGDTVLLYHTGALYNCCATVEFTVSQQDTLIIVTEAEQFDSAGPCDCNCCFDLSVTISDLEPDTYLLQVWAGDTLFYGELTVVIGGATLGDVAQSECLPGTETPSKMQEPCDDSVFAELCGDTLRIHHAGAFYNCCAVIEFSHQQENSTIDLTERETFPEGPCYCLCCFDLSIDLIALPPGEYLVRVWDEYHSVLYGEVEVVIPGAPVPAMIVQTLQSGCTNSYLRGDVDESYGIEMGDAVHVLRFIYIPGATVDCLDAADANDDGEISMSDGIHLLRHLYVPGSSPPSPPYPDCGQDPTADRLGCDLHWCTD